MTRINRVRCTAPNKPRLTYDQTVLADTPLHYWPLTDTSGTTATDLVGAGTLNGAYTGSAGTTYTLNQPLGDLTGVALAGGYVLLKTGIILAQLANCSVEFRAITTIRASAQPYYCERASSGNDIWKVESSGTSPNGTLNFTHRNDGGTLDRPTATTAIDDGVVRHLVLTKAGRATVLYINSVNRGTGTLTATNTDVLTNANMETRVGMDKADPTHFFTGTIGQLAIYNYALSQAQVSTHYAAS